MTQWNCTLCLHCIPERCNKTEKEVREMRENKWVNI